MTDAIVQNVWATTAMIRMNSVKPHHGRIPGERQDSLTGAHELVVRRIRQRERQAGERMSRR